MRLWAMAARQTIYSITSSAGRARSAAPSGRAPDREPVLRYLGRYCDRTLASYWAFCRHPRSSLRATIVSRVTEAAAGRKFSLAACDRIVIETSRGGRIRDRLLSAEDEDLAGAMREPGTHRVKDGNSRQKRGNEYRRITYGIASGYQLIDAAR